jgi:hypothetical protein
MPELNESNELLSPDEMRTYLAMAKELITLERVEAENASRPRYADAARMRFPVYTAELAVASKVFYDNANETHKAVYSAEQWENIGNVISAALGYTNAAHNEEEDVNLVLQAMVLVRELVAREAIDGAPDSTWKLSDLVYCLQLLCSLKWQEEWDVYFQEEMAEASVSEEETTATDTVEIITATEGEEDMAISDDDLAKIAEVNKASNEELKQSLADNTAALLAGLKEILSAAAPVAPVVASTEVEAEVEAPVVEAQGQAEAAFPPADDKKDEEDDEEDDKDSKASAPVAPVVATNLTPAERAGRAAELALDQEAEAAKAEAADRLEANVGGGGGAASLGTLGTASFRLWDPADVDKVLSAQRESVTAGLTKRLKGTAIAVANGGGPKRDASEYAEAFIALLSRN